MSNEFRPCAVCIRLGIGCATQVKGGKAPNSFLDVLPTPDNAKIYPSEVLVHAQLLIRLFVTTFVINENLHLTEYFIVT